MTEGSQHAYPAVGITGKDGGRGELQMKQGGRGVLGGRGVGGT